MALYPCQPQHQFLSTVKLHKETGNHGHTGSHLMPLGVGVRKGEMGGMAALVEGVGGVELLPSPDIISTHCDKKKINYNYSHGKYYKYMQLQWIVHPTLGK